MNLFFVSPRCTVETFMSPFHLVRVRLQRSSGPIPQGPLDWARGMASLVRDEGFGVWRGLPPRLMWVAPLSSFMFVYYETVT